MNIVLQYLSSTLALLRGMPRPARVGLFLFFVAGLADGVLVPFFALWAQKDAGIPTEYIGLLFGCYAGGELLATPFVGGIADRVGRRPVLLVSTLGVGLGFLLLYFSRGAFAAAASLIVIGLFESVLHPTAATVIADTVPADNLRAHFALNRMASNAGGMLGPAVGALLALWSLGLVFLGAAASLLVGALIVALFLSETWQRKAAGADEDDDEESLTALTAAFHDRRLAALLLPIAVIEIALSWIEAVTPLYANNAGTLTPSGVGLLFTYAGLLGVLFQLPVTQASARISGFKIVLASGVAQAVAFACLLTRGAAAAGRRRHAPGAVSHAGRAAHPDHRHGARTGQCAGDLHGGVRGDRRPQGRRRSGGRDVSLRHHCDAAMAGRPAGYCARRGGARGRNAAT